MDWQLALVGLALLLAAGYLGRRAWRTWGKRGSACGGCGCASKPPVGPPLIPADQLRLRVRERPRPS
jgi:hypothetical protein